jgi:lysophospholipase L1-like esterase
LRQGEFEGIKPAWVVINIGTNNLTGTDNARSNTPEEIAAAIGEIILVVHERSPQSRILLMGIFPRGEKPGGGMRAQILATNTLLAQRVAHVPYVTFLDIGSRFLTPDGTLPRALFPDETHPNEAGYAIWADALTEAGIHP